MAGFLTYGLLLNITFLGFSQWYMDKQLANYSCGYSHGKLTVFPIIPLRGTIVSEAIVNRAGAGK